MDPTSGPECFNGTIFHVWKGNQPCRIYIAGGQVYFIRRAVGGMNPSAAAVIGSQFGLLGGLAVGLVGVVKAKTSADFVRDDDPTPPDQLLAKHADNYAIPVSDLIEARIEPKGKHASYGMNAGRWHFMRRGDAKETVVLLESPADASRAVLLLGGVLGRRLRNESGIVGAPATAGAPELVTGLALPAGESRTPERKQLGQQRLGAPISATFDALISAVDRKGWADFQREPVGYYFGKMIGWWLLRLMDNALSDRQLQAVAPEEVKAITLLLFRDMFRHNSLLLRPQTADAGWVETLFEEVAAGLELPATRLRDDGKPYEIEDIDHCEWASTLAAPFGFPAEKLFACHSAIVTGAQEAFRHT